MFQNIHKDTLQFLAKLKDNNDRDWFNKNKDRFIAANENFILFIQTLINEIGRFDKAVVGMDAKKTVFRIYRDTRFAKDKSPYKINFGASLMMGPAKGSGLAGYYFHLQPGGSFLAGGVHLPEPAALKAIRQEISHNGEAFSKIISDKNFKDKFELAGERLSKVPPGFEKDNPMAAYLKLKELLVMHPLDDAIVLSDDLTMYSTGVFKLMVPFNSFLNAPFG